MERSSTISNRLHYTAIFLKTKWLGVASSVLIRNKNELEMFIVSCTNT